MLVGPNCLGDGAYVADAEDALGLFLFLRLFAVV